MELVLRTHEDVEGCSNGVRTLRGGGRMICFDKEVG